MQATNAREERRAMRLKLYRATRNHGATADSIMRLNADTLRHLTANLSDETAAGIAAAIAAMVKR